MAVKTGTRLNALTAGLLGFVFVLPGAALAQQDDHHGRDNGEQHQQAPRPAPAPRAAPAPAAMERGRAPGQWNGQARPAPGLAGNAWQGRGGQPNYANGQGQPAYRGQPANQGQPAYRGQPGNPGQPAYQGQRNGYNAGRDNGGQFRDGNGQRYGGQNRDGGQWSGPGGRGPDGQGRGGQWNHNWRQDNRYDWRDYREANRDAYHVGRYYAPYRDYSYNRLGVGFYLQPLFFGSDYWIADPWDYRLPPAYGPYHWVRYYDDVVLVNTYNGQVADVIYDFFW